MADPKVPQEVEFGPQLPSWWNEFQTDPVYDPMTNTSGGQPRTMPENYVAMNYSNPIYRKRQLENFTGKTIEELREEAALHSQSAMDGLEYVLSQPWSIGALGNPKTREFEGRTYGLGGEMYHNGNLGTQETGLLPLINVYQPRDRVKTTNHELGHLDEILTKGDDPSRMMYGGKHGPNDYDKYSEQSQRYSDYVYDIDNKLIEGYGQYGSGSQAMMDYIDGSLLNDQSLNTFDPSQYAPEDIAKMNAIIEYRKQFDAQGHEGHGHATGQHPQTQQPEQKGVMSDIYTGFKGLLDNLIK